MKLQYKNSTSEKPVCKLSKWVSSWYNRGNWCFTIFLKIYATNKNVLSLDGTQIIFYSESKYYLEKKKFKFQKKMSNQRIQTSVYSERGWQMAESFWKRERPQLLRQKIRKTRKAKKVFSFSYSHYFHCYIINSINIKSVLFSKGLQKIYI